jgi:hypothetical protein
VTAGRQERVEQNELVFRRANERLREDWRRLGMGEEDMALFLCECGDAACKDPVRVRLSDYEAVRADPDAFLLVPGHEDEAVERVVTGVIPENGEVAVVRKRAAEEEAEG